MKKYNVTLKGVLPLKNIEAEDEDEAYMEAMRIACERFEVHEILEDGDIEEVKGND